MNGVPYLSRSAMLDYLMNNEGHKESTAKTYVQESKKGRLIYNLLNAQIVRSHQHGWIVVNETTASQMLLQK